ncbi:MAG: hypothetical protein KUG80_02480 [Gammaproteobacteria bacterium]|nr:hypothetical protein [Gammaproteobacteria bacterium]
MKNRILQIRLFHEYFDSGFMQDVILLPAPETKKFIDKYELLIVQDKEGFSLHYFGCNSFSDFCQSLSILLVQQSFVFYIKSYGLSFSVISEWPLSWLGLVHYSSRNFVLSHTEEVELLADFVSDGDFKDDIFAQISIFPQDLFNPDGVCVYQIFDVKIQARKTQWFYYIFNRSGLDLSAPVVTNRKGIEFNAPESIIFDNGEEVLRFSSGENHFVLCETAKTTLKLIDYPSPVQSGVYENVQASKEIIRDLPIPMVDKINIKISKGQQLACSEMYVYV